MGPPTDTRSALRPQAAACLGRGAGGGGQRAERRSRAPAPHARDAALQLGGGRWAYGLMVGCVLLTRACRYVCFLCCACRVLHSIYLCAFARVVAFIVVDVCACFFFFGTLESAAVPRRTRPRTTSCGASAKATRTGGSCCRTRTSGKCARRRRTCGKRAFRAHSRRLVRTTGRRTRLPLKGGAAVRAGSLLVPSGLALVSADLARGRAPDGSDVSDDEEVIGVVFRFMRSYA